MFEKCETIKDVLKRFLELSRSFPDHQMATVITDICAAEIVTHFKKQIMAELYREQSGHNEKEVSAIEENSYYQNPLLGKTNR